MPETIGRELVDYWPMERELLAVIAEILDSILLVTVKAHGGKPNRDALRIPRPSSRLEANEGEKPISMGQMMHVLKG